jgi:hypothetical protein
MQGKREAAERGEALRKKGCARKELTTTQGGCARMRGGICAKRVQCCSVLKCMQSVSGRVEERAVDAVQKISHRLKPSRAHVRITLAPQLAHK